MGHILHDHFVSPPDTPEEERTLPSLFSSIMHIRLRADIGLLNWQTLEGRFLLTQFNNVSANLHS